MGTIGRQLDALRESESGVTGSVTAPVGPEVAVGDAVVYFGVEKGSLQAGPAGVPAEVVGVREHGLIDLLFGKRRTMVVEVPRGGAGNLARPYWDLPPPAPESEPEEK